MIANQKIKHWAFQLGRSVVLSWSADGIHNNIMYIISRQGSHLCTDDKKKNYWRKLTNVYNKENIFIYELTSEYCKPILFSVVADKREHVILIISCLWEYYHHHRRQPEQHESFVILSISNHSTSLFPYYSLLSCCQAASSAVCPTSANRSEIWNVCVTDKLTLLAVWSNWTPLHLMSPDVNHRGLLFIRTTELACIIIIDFLCQL